VLNFFKKAILVFKSSSTALYSQSISLIVSINAVRNAEQPYLTGPN